MSATPPPPVQDVQARLTAELRRRVGSLPEDLVVNGDEPAAFRRFLVARKWDVDKAEEQLRHALAWRSKTFGIAAFLAKPPVERLALVRRLLPSNPFLGLSKAGYPVSLCCLGASDPASVAKQLTADDLIADFVVRAEFYRAVVFVQASQQVGETVDKEIVLLDFGGMSLGLLKLLPLFKEMNAVGSTYFPERTVLFFVLNAPRIFTSLWSMVKGLVDPRTQKKVHILSEGKRQLAALREVIDDSIIPVAYGGSRVAPAVSGKDETQTRAIYQRLDAWLAEAAAGKTPPPSTPAPAAAQALPPSEVAPPTPLAAPTPSPLSPARLADGTPAKVGAVSAAASPPAVQEATELARVPVPRISHLDMLVLVLLWLGGTCTFSMLLWAQLSAVLP